LPYKDEEARRSYNKEYQKKWYAENREKHIKNAKINKAKANKRNREHVLKCKLRNPCKCGESNPICLSFHHVRGEKEYNIADLVNSGCSIKKLQKEMDKCEIKCLNCHAIETNGNGNGKNKHKKKKRKKVELRMKPDM
jgi:hypothetical protein